MELTAHSELRSLFSTRLVEFHVDDESHDAASFCTQMSRVIALIKKLFCQKRLPINPRVCLIIRRSENEENGQEKELKFFSSKSSFSFGEKSSLRIDRNILYGFS